MQSLEQIEKSMAAHRKAALENGDNPSIYNYHIGAYNALKAVIEEE